jgi:hypothetical protein
MYWTVFLYYSGVELGLYCSVSTFYYHNLANNSLRSYVLWHVVPSNCNCPYLDYLLINACVLCLVCLLSSAHVHVCFTYLRL